MLFVVICVCFLVFLWRAIDCLLLNVFCVVVSVSVMLCFVVFCCVCCGFLCVFPRGRAIVCLLLIVVVLCVILFWVGLCFFVCGLSVVVVVVCGLLFMCFYVVWGAIACLLLVYWYVQFCVFGCVL